MFAMQAIGVGLAYLILGWASSLVSTVIRLLSFFKFVSVLIAHIRLYLHITGKNTSKT
jgi:hypothetical protein